MQLMLHSVQVSHLEISSPFPWDAIVSGDEMIFSATVVTSFRVTPSTALRRCSTGFLRGFMKPRLGGPVEV